MSSTHGRFLRLVFLIVQFVMDEAISDQPLQSSSLKMDGWQRLIRREQTFAVATFAPRPTQETISAEILSGSNEHDEDVKIGDPDQYLDALAGNLTNHVDIRRSCGAGPECFCCGGPAKVKHVARLVREAFKNGVAGDFVETGAWRGGIGIMARMAQRVSDGDMKSGRRTYVCDSYQGLPHNSTSEDADIWSNVQWMKVSIEEVRSNFARFGALDSQVLFVKGYFQYSMPLLRHSIQSEGRQIAILRADADMFEGYYDALYNLYEFLSVGGYFICDDCSSIPGAAKAVQLFRKDHGISEPIQLVDVCTEAYTVYIGDFWWKKEKDVKVNYDAYVRWNATRHTQNTPSLLQTGKVAWSCKEPPRAEEIKW